MAFFVRDCVRCGVKRVQHLVVGSVHVEKRNWEVAGACADCRQISIYGFYANPNNDDPLKFPSNLELAVGATLAGASIRIATTAVDVSDAIPARIAGLFREANECRQMTWYEAAGCMYRKTIDVATKHIYSHDARLQGKEAANALRSRIKALGEMKILEADIVELADVAALDGNDAAHDVDPYTKEEAEALEDLTSDLLDRLFVRPARLAAVKAKQIAAGQRKAD